MNNIDTVAHMNMHYTQYWAHWALFIDAQLCHIAPLAQVRLARVIPSMHVHLCVASWLFSPRLSLFSTSSHRSPSSLSWCSPQSSTRGPGPTPCATSAWGPWSLLTMRHPSHPQTSSSAPYPQELNSTWRKTIEEPIQMSTAEKSGRPERDPDLRCQSRPSAKDSVIFSGGDSSKNYGADQQRLQISDLLFDKFPTPATLACWKIRFKTEVCTCPQFPTDAMQWIKEVELVDSVDDLRSSSSTRGISNAEFWSTWCENCFSPEQDHP